MRLRRRIGIPAPSYRLPQRPRPPFGSETDFATVSVRGVNHKTVVVYSLDRRYRYYLQWIFDGSKPLLVVCMLNPSTASHVETDPTIDGLLKRARAWGYGGIAVVNVYAYRSAYPKDLAYQTDPVGEHNRLYQIYALELAKAGGLFLCGWGTHKGALAKGKQLELLALADHIQLHCLAVNANGSPKHPLYIKHDQTPIPWGTLPESLAKLWQETSDEEKHNAKASTRRVRFGPQRRLNR